MKSILKVIPRVKKHVNDGFIFHRLGDFFILYIGIYKLSTKCKIMFLDYF